MPNAGQNQGMHILVITHTQVAGCLFLFFDFKYRVGSLQKIKCVVGRVYLCSLILVCTSFCRLLVPYGDVSKNIYRIYSNLPRTFFFFFLKNGSQNCMRVTIE